MAAPRDRKPYQDILVITLGFVALSFIFELELLMYIGLGIGALAIVVPPLAPWISLGWFKLGEGLGWINGKLLLSVVFFIFLIPVALIYRWTRKNPLYRKNPEESVFQVRDHKYTAEDMADPW